MSFTAQAIGQFDGAPGGVLFCPSLSVGLMVFFLVLVFGRKLEGQAPGDRGDLARFWGR